MITAPEVRRACCWWCASGTERWARRSKRWQWAGRRSRRGTWPSPWPWDRWAPGVRRTGNRPRTAWRCARGTGGCTSTGRRARRTPRPPPRWPRPRLAWTGWRTVRRWTRAACASDSRWQNNGRRWGRSTWTRRRRSKRPWPSPTLCTRPARMATKGTVLGKRTIILLLQTSAYTTVLNWLRCLIECHWSRDKRKRI